MSIPLAITTVMGVAMVFVGAYSRVLLPTTSPELGVIIFLLSVFSTMLLAIFSEVRRSLLPDKSESTNCEGSRVTGELGLDNIEDVFRDKGMKFAAGMSTS